MTPEQRPEVVQVDITTPATWGRHWSREFGGTGAIVIIAFSPTALLFGAEIIRTGAKGVGFCVGPLWLGFAVARRIGASHPERRSENG